MHEFPYSEALDHVISVLSKAVSDCGYESSEQDIRNSTSFTDKFTDISSTIPMKISKMLSINKDEAAGNISKKIQPDDTIKDVYPKNGFVNFDLHRDRFSKDVMNHITNNPESFLKSDFGNGKKIIVEYPSVNPAHPLHIGHIRSALLGDVISNIMEECGYSVEREDYIDDLGLQAAEALWGTMNMDTIGLSFNPSKKYDHMLGDIYVAVNKKMKEDPTITDGIKDVSKLMEQDGTYESKLLKDMVEKFIKSEYETLFKMGVFHTLLVWESDILNAKLLEKALKILEDNKITEFPKDGSYANCVVVDINKLNDLPKEFAGLKENTKVLVRSNGTSNYISKDIAFHMWKFGLLEDAFKYAEFMKQPNGQQLYSTSRSGEGMGFGNVDVSINTIDSRQSYEQSLMGIILSQLGGYKGKDLIHIPYGVVDLEEGALSGRKGSWIGFTADDLIREAERKAMELLSGRNDLPEDEKASISSSVAMSAIRFEFLKISYEKKITFSWERALNFEGNSGPYCQYMYARAMHIINASPNISKEFDYNSITSDVEFTLVKKMAAAQDILERSARENRPNILVNYISDLSTLFSKFYEAKHVINADTEDEKAARMALVVTFKVLMERLLGICGIDALEKM